MSRSNWIPKILREAIKINDTAEIRKYIKTTINRRVLRALWNNKETVMPYCYYSMIDAFAKNANTPTEILQEIYHTTGISTKSICLENPSIPKECIVAAINSSYRELKIAVLNNPVVDDFILLKLSTDADDIVAGAAQTAIKQKYHNNVISHGGNSHETEQPKGY